MRSSIESFCILKPHLAVKIGEPEALLLERIVAYLKGNAHELEGENGKIYNSVRQWQEDHFPHWSIYKLKKAIKSLEEKGLIKSVKANKAICNHTKWYTVDEEKYIELLEESGIQDFCFLRANRKVKTQPIYKVTKSYYTKESSSKEKEDIFTQLELNLERRINEIIEKKIDERLNEIFEERVLNLPKSCDDRSGERINSSGKVLSGKSCIKDYNTASDMIDIWNAVFNYSVNGIRGYVNKKNQRELVNILKIQFGGSIEAWREYAYKVNSSKFLMGEKQTRQDFKASFAWLIKSETIKAIQAGEYGVGDRELDMNNISGNLESKEEEIAEKLNKKIIDQVKLGVSNKTLKEEEFKEYIAEKRYLEDGDKYKLERTVEGIGAYELLNMPEYKKIKESLYESYLTKKRIGKSRFEIRDELKAKVEGLSFGMRNEESVGDAITKLSIIGDKLERVGLKQQREEILKEAEEPPFLKLGGISEQINFTSAIEVNRENRGVI